MTSPSPERPWRRYLPAIIGGALALPVFIVGGLTITEPVRAAISDAVIDAASSGGVAASDAPTNPLVAAIEECGLEYVGSAELIDDDQALVLDMRGEDDQRGLSASSIECVLDELDLPESDWQVMLETRALDGRQETDWGDFVASWSYHPDTGLDVIVEIID